MRVVWKCLAIAASASLASCASLLAEGPPEQKFYFGGYEIGIFLTGCDITAGRIISLGAAVDKPTLFTLTASTPGAIPTEFDVKCAPVLPNSYGKCSVARHVETARYQTGAPVCGPGTYYRMSLQPPV